MPQLISIFKSLLYTFHYEKQIKNKEHSSPSTLRNANPLKRNDEYTEKRWNMRESIPMLFKIL